MNLMHCGENHYRKMFEGCILHPLAVFLLHLIPKTIFEYFNMRMTTELSHFVYDHSYHKIAHLLF